MSNFTTNIENILPGGEEYKYLYLCIENLKMGKTVTEMNNELEIMKRIFSRCFDMNCTFTILDTTRDESFFGLNIFPDTDVCLNMIDGILDSKSRKMDDVKNIWKENNSWHIDFDIKLFRDISRSLTTPQIIALIYYKIECICFNCNTVELIYRTIRRGLLQLPYVANQIAKAKICRNLYIIPFIRACSYSNYITKIDEVMLINSNEKIKQNYVDAVMNLLKYYGTTDLIDRNPMELVNSLQYDLEWVFESLNDLKYRMGLLKTNLRSQIFAEKSIFVKDILISIFKTFASYDDPSLVKESTGLKNIPPKMQEMADKVAMERFTKQLNKVTESIAKDFFDSFGKARKISQEDIDVLRIESNRIENIDDKIYYLTKCYDLMNVVDHSLTLLQDKELAKKVTQSKNVLLKQKDELMNIRGHIVNTPLTVKKYGLFIEYPEGYKG